MRFHQSIFSAILFSTLIPVGTAGITNTGNNFLASSGTADSWIGYTSPGTLGIDGDSDFATNFITLGYTATGNGTVNVTGEGSTLTSNNSITVGLNGTGTFNITGGGRVISNGSPLLPAAVFIYIGRNAGSKGYATVDGAGSQWYLPETGMGIGNVPGSMGSLTVRNGGTITLAEGNFSVNYGDLLVTGRDSVTNAASKLEMLTTNAERSFQVAGSGGTATATVSDGGILNTAGINRVGSFLGQDGTLAVTGNGSQWNVRGTLVVGASSGMGTVTVADGGLLSVRGMNSPEGAGDGILSLGGTPSSSNVGTPASVGVLRIGTGGAAGRLNVAEVNGFPGGFNPNYVAADSTIIFNHNESAYAFTNTAGNGILISGSTKVKIEGGTTVFNIPSTYTGGTEISGGKLVVNNTSGSATGTGNLTVGVNGAIGGSGHVGGNAAVAGILDPGNSPGTLTFGKDLTLATTTLTIVQLASGTLYDTVTVGGVLTLGGTLQIELLDGYFPEGGATFDIFDADPAKITGTFDSIQISKPGYTATMDYTTGILTVIPEPAVAMLGVALLPMLMLRRRR